MSLAQPLTLIEWYFRTLAVIKLFSLEHSQFWVDLVGRSLWMKAQNSVEAVSLSDSVFGGNLQGSAEQKQQQ